MSTQPYPNSQAIFYRQYEMVRRDEVVGMLLALFLGGFGIHQFYLRRIGLGILYLCFSWTPIPWVLGFIECFFMPGTIREFNAIQAAGIATSLGIAMPGWGQPFNRTVNMPPAAQPGTLHACARCGQTNPSGARFCSACGATLLGEFRQSTGTLNRQPLTNIDRPHHAELKSPHGDSRHPTF